MKLRMIYDLKKVAITKEEKLKIAMVMVMFLASLSGKNDDFKERIPTTPKTKNAKIKTLTAMWYLIKYEMRFLMAGVFMIYFRQKCAPTYRHRHQSLVWPRLLGHQEHS